jgi:hypothetical protein
MMKPYRDRNNNPRRVKRYNQAHSATRVLVEHANGRLKNTWRRLKHLDVRSRHKGRVIIRCCLVLHNYMLKMDCESDRENAAREMATLRFDTACGKREAICKTYFKAASDEDTVLE